MLALYKFCHTKELNRQMTEVMMFQPTLELGTILLNSERALSCHLIFLWKSLARFGLFWGVLWSC
jgi:hypothetical protein